jgi:hypothetical protein
MIIPSLIRMSIHIFVRAPVVNGIVELLLPQIKTVIDCMLSFDIIWRHEIKRTAISREQLASAR